MAKAENFYLEIGGGAVVLQQMAKEVVHNSAMQIAQAATRMSGVTTGHKANLKVTGSIDGIGGKPNAKRYVASIYAADEETEAQLTRGNYIAKAVDAGKV
jgi:hypothetical protein